MQHANGELLKGLNILRRMGFLAPYLVTGIATS